jgi:hypothetical protein
MLRHYRAGLWKGKGHTWWMSYHIRSVPSLSTRNAPGYGFTMPKKKLVSSGPEIFFAAKGEAWRNLVLGMGARGKGQRPFPRSSLEKHAGLRETASSARDS